MKVALWIVQILLAAMFLMAGVMKATTPLGELATQMAWVSAVPPWVPRLAGVSEILGAIGLILPAATRILPALTPLAAAGLATVMALASGLHLTRGEFGMLPLNAMLFAAAVFVVWGRTKKVRIEPRRTAAPSAVRA